MPSLHDGFVKVRPPERKPAQHFLAGKLVVSFSLGLVSSA